MASSTGGSLLQAKSLGLLLVRSTLSGADPCVTSSKLRLFAERRSLPLVSYYPVAGIEVAKSLEIDGRTRLLTWDDVPECRAKLQFKPHVNPPFHEYGWRPDLAVPSCAIEMRHGNEMRLFASHEEANCEIPDDDRWRLAADNMEEVQDVLRAIFIFGKCRTAILGHWQQSTEPVIEELTGSAVHSYGSIYDITLPQPVKISLDEVDLPSLWKSFRDLAPTTKEVFRHSLDRLRSSVQRTTLIDQMIDLGIALEMLVLHGSDKAELKYRLALRGAMFNSHDKVKRFKDYKLLKTIYDLRSTAVHQGRFNSKNQEQATGIICEGLSVAADIAKKLIEHGGFPNWEEDLILVS